MCLDRPEVRQRRRHQVVVQHEHERQRRIGVGDLRGEVEQILAPDHPARAQVAARQERRVVRGEEQRLPVVCVRHELREEGRLAAVDEHVRREARAQRREDIALVRTEEAQAAPIVVARNEQGGSRAPEGVIDAAEQRLHLVGGATGLDGRRVEEITRDDNEIDRTPAPRPLALDRDQERSEDRILLGGAREQV